MENKTFDLQPVQETQITTFGTDPVLKLIQKVVEGGVTESNVAALDKLLAVYERLDDKRAEREFNSAFVALQGDLPVIVAETIIPNRGKYCRFEDLMHQVGPILVKHGFTVSFSMENNENRIVQHCHLRHIGGHSKTNSFAVRVGGKADSETQADCKASSVARRNALMSALNIVIRQDALTEEYDATQDGSPISWEQVEYLKQEVKDTGSDEAAFLRFAGVHKYEDIGTSRYDSLVSALNKKARK